MLQKSYGTSVLPVDTGLCAGKPILDANMAPNPGKKL